MIFSVMLSSFLARSTELALARGSLSKGSGITLHRAEDEDFKINKCDIALLTRQRGRIEIESHDEYYCESVSSAK